MQKGENNLLDLEHISSIFNKNKHGGMCMSITEQTSTKQVILCIWRNQKVPFYEAIRIAPMKQRVRNKRHLMICINEDTKKRNNDKINFGFD